LKCIKTGLHGPYCEKRIKTCHKQDEPAIMAFSDSISNNNQQTIIDESYYDFAIVYWGLTRSIKKNAYQSIR